MWLLACGARVGRGTDDPAAVLDDALSQVSTACRELVGREFRRGQKLEPGCNVAREQVARRVAKLLPARFGVLEQQFVDLHAMSFIFSEAFACDRWPLRVEGHEVLSVAAATRAGCRVRRFHGEIPVTLTDMSGRRYEGALSLAVIHGMLRVGVPELDRMLRMRGLAGIDELRSLEFGEDGWGGWVNLKKLREIRGVLHWQWIRQGRGAPTLFLARYPDHPVVNEARTRALEVTRAREARDLARVKSGKMSSAAFLARYPGSAHRQLVTTLDNASFPRH